MVVASAPAEPVRQAFNCSLTGSTEVKRVATHSKGPWLEQYPWHSKCLSRDWPVLSVTCATTIWWFSLSVSRQFPVLRARTSCSLNCFALTARSSTHSLFFPAQLLAQRILSPSRLSRSLVLKKKKKKKKRERAGPDIRHMYYNHLVYEGLVFVQSVFI
jgi:hypothetical protein